jgi:zinc transporter
LDGKGPKDAADFMVQLATRLIERMEPVINNLDEDTDNLEEKIIDEPDIKLRTEIIKMRKEAILLRRYLAPQREVISRLRTSEQKWLTKIHKRQLHENYDRITRYVEDLDSIRERTQIVQDELQNSIADKLNKNMYILSVIAAIFLPLGFLTGLLGINVGGIPGADNPDAFMIFCGVLVVLVLVQVVLFKRMKWF